MTAHPLPPQVQTFFAERLISQLGASPNTVASYRDTFRLLLGFASNETGRRPTDLRVEDIDAGLIGRFLDHLESGRQNTARSRNSRLTAIRSFFSHVFRPARHCSDHCARTPSGFDHACFPERNGDAPSSPLRIAAQDRPQSVRTDR